MSFRRRRSEGGGGGWSSRLSDPATVTSGPIKTRIDTGEEEEEEDDDDDTTHNEHELTLFFVGLRCRGFLGP